MRRRDFLKHAGRLGLAAGLAGPLSSSYAALPSFSQLTNPFDQGMLNDCTSRLPKNGAVQEALAIAWEGIDPAQMWDAHAHLVGVGDNGSGIYNTPDMDSWLHPLEKMRKWFYLHAACGNMDEKRSVDDQVIERLVILMRDFPEGARLMLYAFDAAYDEQGTLRRDKTAFHIPNRYARKIAAASPDRFEWVASIHPYRRDALTVLAEAVAGGAKAIKWLPAAMGIDPAHPLCLPFYEQMAHHNLPLISHAGQERAVHGANRQDYSNPLKLRKALDAGVRVVVAHCASIGQDLDLDAGKAAQPVLSFTLFERMMNQAEYEGRLVGEISAVTQANRSAEILRILLTREAWRKRLLNGSDYPLPAVPPFFLPKRWVAAGMLDEKHLPALKAVRSANPLLFDFLLKRLLRWKGQGFSASVFETRRFFNQVADIKADTKKATHER